MYTTIVGILTLLLIFIWYLKKRNDYWKDRSVPYEEGKLLVGNMWETFCERKNQGEVYDYFYKKFHDAKYCGVLNFGTPTLLVRDPELLERIFIKDFSKFHNNSFIVDEKKDPVLTKSPFFARDDQWKLLRNQLTPQFTPLKVKNMFHLIEEVKDGLINYLNEKLNTGWKDGFDAGYLTKKYTNAVVSSCGFGITYNRFEDDIPEIMELTNVVFQLSTADVIGGVAASMFPILYKIRSPQVLPTKTADRFKDIILSTLKERQEKNIRRGDFLDIIAEMKKKATTFEYTPDHMTAHVTSFFIDGAGTTAVVLQYALYELAKNKSIQDKLRTEFKGTLEENGGKLSYDRLQEIEYAEMIIYETLRKHPAGLFLFKECTETTTFPPARNGGKEFTIEKGTPITIPILSIHNDPQYYEDPEIFDPDRFSADAKMSRPKAIFFGFGDGPRICIGRRFALTVLKVALFGIITNFEVELNEKTPKKLELDPTQFLYTTKGGIWLNFYPIHNSV